MSSRFALRWSLWLATVGTPRYARLRSGICAQPKAGRGGATDATSNQPAPQAPRDEDGLALSSRNAYLSELERRRALSLKRALDAARAAIADGATHAQEVVEAAMKELDQPGVEPEYVEVVSARDLSQLDQIAGEDVLIAVAARVGRARLIDNTVVSHKPMPRSASAVQATG